MKHLLLLLTLPVALFGCDLLSTQDGPRAVIESITLEAIPQQRPDGRPWDNDGTGPDLYVQMNNTLGRVFVTSGIMADATPDDLEAPLMLQTKETVQTLDRDYFVQIVDLDAGTARGYEQMGMTVSRTFQPDADITAIPAEGLPGEVSFQSEDGKFVARVAVRWYAE